MGIMGIILFPLILVFILRLIESVSKGIKEGMMFVVVFSVGLTLLSTTFTIALLNNGILLMMIMLYFLPRRNIA
jgi:FtsH-binding integral membrane protein